MLLVCVFCFPRRDNFELEIPDISVIVVGHRSLSILRIEKKTCGGAHTRNFLSMKRNSCTSKSETIIIGQIGLQEMAEQADRIRRICPKESGRNH